MHLQAKSYKQIQTAAHKVGKLAIGNIRPIYVERRRREQA